MSTPNPTQARIASLHLHPVEPGAPMIRVESAQLVAEAGIAGNSRYFGRRHRLTGKPAKRQVSLIERERLAQHAAVLGLESIPPGAVRSNIETEGIDLAQWLNREIRIGEAVLLICEAREPCAKMDAVCQGLRELMMDGRQGVIAQVIRSGEIRIGHAIQAVEVEIKP